MAQEIIRIETINTNIVNVATTEVIKIEGVGLQGNSGDNVGVLSFNGRIGIVSPELYDYQASLITNDSTETGATVKDALDALDIEQDTQNTDITTNAGDIVTINNEQIVQNDAITAIEDTAVFESPVSPYPVNYIWLGNQFQYDLIGLNGNPYEDDTIYNVNNNLKSTFYFYTKDFSPVTPILSNVTPDSQSAGSNEGVILANGSPSYSYADPSVEHLVEFDNFDPLDVTTVDINTDGLQSISDINSLTSLTVLRLYRNQLTDIGDLSGLTSLTVLSVFENQLTDIGDLSGLTSLTVLSLHTNQLTDVGDLSGLTSLTDLRLYNNQLTDIGDLSGLTSLTNLQLYNNNLTDIGGLGSTSLTTIRLDTNALTQASVDNVINDTDASGVSNGTLSLNGGTNSAPSVASDTARTNLIGKGWTLTFN
jgi:hypothetical protein